MATLASTALRTQYSSGDGAAALRDFLRFFIGMTPPDDIHYIRSSKKYACDDRRRQGENVVYFVSVISSVMVFSTPASSTWEMAPRANTSLTLSGPTARTTTSSRMELMVP